MKFLNKILIIISGCVVLASCTDLDTLPGGSSVSTDQKQDIVEAKPERLAADVNGMFSNVATQYCIFGERQNRHDDFGFPSVCLSQDLNGPDMVADNSGYNWFTVSSEYSDRSDTYANPYMRYAVFYNQIKAANDVLASIPEDTENELLVTYKGQAKAVRAFDYLSLVPYFQYKYKGNEDAPGVPIVTHDMDKDPANNPRATLREVYEQILSDLDDAIISLEGYQRSSKAEIDQQVAYGLRARAHLYMENWNEAASDATKALAGYSPYSRNDVSAPRFISANDPNWMWALIILPVNMPDAYPSWPAVISSFSGDSYSAGVGCYKSINRLLFDLIPDTDVRKGWWVDENLESDNLATVQWGDARGNEIPPLVINEVKVPFVPYANVKFGQYEQIGGTINAGDWCIMRAEEMILIQAEATAMRGDLASGKQILESFVRTYRDPAYVSRASSATEFQNEVWFQRRVELWGEGFSMSDIMRLGKNVVRVKAGVESNYPIDFQFNMAANDPWLLMRFPQKETNNNRAVENNTGGTQPSEGNGAGLKDGVTD